MKKLSQPLIPGLILALVVSAPLHAQTETNQAATTAAATKTRPAGQAPDDATGKITELVHAGKYAEAQQLTAGLLVVYPNDQRLIKAKALIEKLLASAASANVARGKSQPAANPNAEQLSGMDKVDYAALIELTRQAQQTMDLLQQTKLLKQFMEQSSVFLQKHSEQMLIWQLRAATAISLNDPLAGYEAGQKLIAAGAADSDDANLQRLLGQLKIKGWLDRQGVEKAEEQNRTILVAFTGDAADEGDARGNGGSNLDINLRNRIEGDVTSQLHSRFPRYHVRINVPASGDPALKVTINLHNTGWTPNCGMWWECNPIVDSQLMVSVSSPTGPIVERTFALHMTYAVSKTFGGNFTEKPVANGLPDWMGQAVLEKFKSVLDEDAVRTSLVNLPPEPAVADASSSAPLDSPAPKPAVPDVGSSASTDNPSTPEPAGPAVPSSAPVAAASASAPGAAILHVYRLHHLTGALLKPYINIDGKPVAQVANAQSVRMELPPGKHNISITEKRAKTDLPIYDLDMVAGQEYWVRADFSSGLVVHLRLYLVPTDQAKSESEQMKKQEYDVSMK